MFELVVVKAPAKTEEMLVLVERREHIRHNIQSKKASFHNTSVEPSSLQLGNIFSPLVP